MTTDSLNLKDRFEPGVSEACSDEYAALVSSAISLKRIADALDGTNPWALNNLMENAGQAFAIGMRGR